MSLAIYYLFITLPLIVLTTYYITLFFEIDIDILLFITYWSSITLSYSITYSKFIYRQQGGAPAPNGVVATGCAGASNSGARKRVRRGRRSDAVKLRSLGAGDGQGSGFSVQQGISNQQSLG